MANRFFGKNPHRKYVRMLPNRNVKHVVEKNAEEEKELKNEKENKENNKDSNMDERLEKIEALTGSKAPKRKVKIEKKDRGLLERTDNSTILLTEDNKMLLND